MAPLPLFGLPANARPLETYVEPFKTEREQPRPGREIAKGNFRRLRGCAVGAHLVNPERAEEPDRSGTFVPNYLQLLPAVTDDYSEHAWKLRQYGHSGLGAT
jgi:hypothetical protein